MNDSETFNLCLETRLKNDTPRHACDTEIPNEKLVSLSQVSLAQLPAHDDDTEKRIWDKEIRKKIISTLHVLTPRQLYIVTKSYGLDGDEPLSMAEIGHKLGQNPETTTSQHNAALNKLRTYIKKRYDLRYNLSNPSFY